jgi:hypothetical protein
MQWRRVAAKYDGTVTKCNVAALRLNTLLLGCNAMLPRCG